MGNLFSSMSASSQSQARGRQGASNAEHRAAAVPWSDSRRAHLLLNAYIGTPLRLCQQPDLATSLGFTWNPAINELSKLKYSHLSKIEKETARFLNSNADYMLLSGQVALTDQVVKSQIKRIVQASANEETTDPESIAYKAKFIATSATISENAMAAAREAANPARNDAIIVSVIVNPAQRLDEDGTPNLLKKGLTC